MIDYCGDLKGIRVENGIKVVNGGLPQGLLEEKALLSIIARI